MYNKKANIEDDRRGWLFRAKSVVESKGEFGSKL